MLRLDQSYRSVRTRYAVRLIQVLKLPTQWFKSPQYTPGTFRADPWQRILTIISLGAIVIVSSFRPDFASFASIVIILGSLAVALWRPRFPLQGLLAQIGILSVSLAFSDIYGSLCLALSVLCLISVGIERPLRIVIPATLLVQVAFFAVLVVLDDDSDTRIQTASIFGVVSGSAGAAGLGVAIRSQRKYIDAINERAVHAEETREAESRRRVSDERMRIARDLHDAVAHHIAVVSVYTGLARTTLNTSTEKTEAALAKAQESTRSVLSELQQIVHILRDSEGAEETSRQPIPEFSQIEDLIATFADTGFRVTYRVHGLSGEIPTSTGLVTYRVVQESLTNAARYGDGAALVDITFGGDAIRIEVSNTISTAERGTQGTGHGLIGMRERVRLIDGSLTYTSDAGMFTLVAVLPWNRQIEIAEVEGNGVATDDQRRDR